MKSHLIIKLKEGAREIDAPHWAEIIADKSPVAEQIDPQIDQLLKSRNIPVWVTREYSPRMEIWSPDEIESGLNRVYRLILQRNDKIPAGIVASIRLLPHDISIDEIEEIDEDTKSSLRKYGIKSGEDLDRLQEKKVDLDEIVSYKKKRKQKNSYADLANIINKAKRRKRAPSVSGVSLTKNADDTVLAVQGMLGTTSCFRFIVPAFDLGM